MSDSCPLAIIRSGKALPGEVEFIEFVTQEWARRFWTPLTPLPDSHPYAAARVTTQPSAGVLVEALRLARPIVEADWDLARSYADADWQGASHTALQAIDQALSATATPASDGVKVYPSLELCVQFSDDGQHIRKWSRLPFDGGENLYSHPTPDRFGEGYRAGEWQDIASAPKDGTEFLSGGGTQGRAGSVYPTKWLSPGPYTTENGKNAPGERRFQYPEGFYWAGYDGFVGPVDPLYCRPLPAAPSIRALQPDAGEGA